MAFEVDFDSEPLKRRLGVIAERMRNPEPALKVTAEKIRTLVIADSFGRSQDPFGKPWKALKQSTIERRRGGSKKPLIDTGNLRGSVVSRAIGSKVIFGVSGDAATYGKAHLFGAKAKSGKERPPQRKFLPVTDEGKPDFSSGPAQKMWTKELRRLAKYFLDKE